MATSQLETVYLFIDGGYLDTAYRHVFEPMFGKDYQIDYAAIKSFFNARRVYYYHCLDELRKKGETETTFNERVARQKKEFHRIEKTEGIHVRKGHLRSSRRKGNEREQKEVDVALAVDMLTNSFNKNMTIAVLLSGDRDFRPAVESVVRLGTYVLLASRSRTTSDALTQEADDEFALTIDFLCQWLNMDRSEKKKQFPRRVHENALSYFDTFEKWLVWRSHGGFHEEYKPNNNAVPQKVGKRMGTDLDAKLYCSHGKYFVTIEVSKNWFDTLTFDDEAKLVAFTEAIYGGIEWKNPSK